MPRPIAVTHRRLIALNVVLLGVLSMVTLAPGAGAQQPASRSRGQYTMVSGSVQGTTNEWVYVLDSSNQEMVALAWDRTRDQLHLVGYRNIARDASRQQQRR